MIIRPHPTGFDRLRLGMGPLRLARRTPSRKKSSDTFLDKRNSEHRADPMCEQVCIASSKEVPDVPQERSANRDADKTDISFLVRLKHRGNYLLSSLPGRFGVSIRWDVIERAFMTRFHPLIVSVATVLSVGAAVAQEPTPILIRNNDVTSVGPVAPPMASLFDPKTGRLHGHELPQTFAYVFHIEDLEQVMDGPLVLYQFTDPGQTLFFTKDGSQLGIDSYTGRCRSIDSGAIGRMLNNLSTLHSEYVHAIQLYGVSGYPSAIVCEDASGIGSVRTFPVSVDLSRDVSLLYLRDALDTPRAFITVVQEDIFDVFNSDGGFRYDRSDPTNPSYSPLDATGAPVQSLTSEGGLLIPSCLDVGIAYNSCLAYNETWLQTTREQAHQAFRNGIRPCSLALASVRSTLKCGIVMGPGFVSLLAPLGAADCDAEIPPGGASCPEPSGASPECLIGAVCDLDSRGGHPHCAYSTTEPGTCSSSRNCGGPGYCTNGRCWTDANLEVCDGYDNNCDGDGAIDETPCSLETMIVPTDVEQLAPYSNTSLVAGKTYRLRASGSFLIAHNTLGDAEYALIPGGEIRNRCGGSPTGLDFGIAVDHWDSDGSNKFPPSWGPYNPAHVYEISYVGQGAPIRVYFTDCGHSDNVGTLRLEIIAPACSSAADCDDGDSCTANARTSAGCSLTAIVPCP